MAKQVYSFESAEFAAQEYMSAKARVELIDSLLPEARKSTLQEIGIIMGLGFLASLAEKVPVLGTLLALALFIVTTGAFIYNVKNYYSKVSGGAAFATIGNIAKWGWILVPIFPIDIFVGLTILVYGFAAMLMLPSLYLRLIRNTEKKRLEEAEMFVGLYAETDSVFEMLTRDSEKYEYHNGTLVEKIRPKFCTHCGNEMDSSMSFCTKCGTKMA